MQHGNLCLHKLASNSPDVMATYLSSALPTNLKDLDLDANDMPSWDWNTRTISGFNYSAVSEALNTTYSTFL